MTLSNWISGASYLKPRVEISNCIFIFLNLYSFWNFSHQRLSQFCAFEDYATLCDASSEFVSSGIPSWQFLTAHAQPFRGARDLVFCLVPLDSLLVWASSGGSGETAWMRRLAWTIAARIGDKYQIRLTQPICKSYPINACQLIPVFRMMCIFLIFPNFYCDVIIFASRNQLNKKK